MVIAGVALLAIVPLALAVTGDSSHAATFAVNSTGDAPDATPGDGICETSTAGECTLRAAIEESNALAGTDTINFNIAGVGPHTISPASELPPIIREVVIDGYSQPGASVNTNPIELGSNAVLMIELDGTNAGALARGLRVVQGPTTVKGLVINRFLGGGIALEHVFTTIEGNYIGIDPTGTIDLGNGIFGIDILYSDNTVGGVAASARNVISGNGSGIPLEGDGIRLRGQRNLVHGNYIGTDASGTADLGNSNNGLYIISPNNTIGGTAPGARNVISGNNFDGVHILTSDAYSNLIQGSFIGTDRSGNSILGNSGVGISLLSAPGNTIGGTASGAGNTISGNLQQGVRIAGPIAGNLISRNSIHSNAGLGIDLSADGVTLNDAGDADTGANELQNYPVITSATYSGSNSTIQGTLNSTPNTAFALEFFSNLACDSSLNGEGQTFLGSTSVTTDGGGNASFSAIVDLPPSGQLVITSTATDPTNNTSEFSTCASATPASPVTSPTPIPVGGIVDLVRAGDTRTSSSGMALFHLLVVIAGVTTVAASALYFAVRRP
ncbi:MAG TPA: right-handed parallel beta-helix repeat-containing protein [Dehalococcoidia bacterium]|nr:right-handed parallel beta-helix repeat-containing protein [Dehalococcoidia bacterium]